MFPFTEPEVSSHLRFFLIFLFFLRLLCLCRLSVFPGNLLYQIDDNLRRRLLIDLIPGLQQILQIDRHRLNPDVADAVD